MRAAPATIGGIPCNSNFASERQSSTSSRSPCTTCTDMAVWPSLKVVNSCARAAGIVVLRAMIFSDRPPIVSRPSDSGITSSSSISSSGLLPARISAWMAAPTATTLSGSISTIGSVLKKSPTLVRTSGTRVEPPTITTDCTSVVPIPASRRARLHGPRVFSTSGVISSSNVSRDNAPCHSLPSARVTLRSTLS